MSRPKRTSLSISLAIYCEDVTSLTKADDLLSTYSPFFGQAILILNLPNGPSFAPSKLNSNVLVLDLKGKISQGAALNKVLPHIMTPKVLLIDVHAPLEQSMITFLYSLQQKLNIDVPYLIGFNSKKSSRLSNMEHEKNTPWHHQLSITASLPWGGIFFDPLFLLSFGGFEDRLSYEIMMMDLCIRAQSKFGIIFQSDLDLCTLNCESKSPIKKEIAYIQQQYPALYPNIFQRFFRKLKSKSDINIVHNFLN
jgi:hypothetical protein